MSASKGPRLQFEIQLPSQESKASFSAVLDEAKRLMTPPGQRKLDNYRLLMSLIDLAKQRLPPLTQASPWRVICLHPGSYRGKSLQVRL